MLGLPHAFTTDNARLMAAKSIETRRRKRLERQQAKEAGLIPEPASSLNHAPEASEEVTTKAHMRVKKQLALCDELLDVCKDADDFAKLTASKERLWKLVYPTQGAYRPRSPKERIRPPSAE